MGGRDAGAEIGPRNWKSGDLGWRVGARPNRIGRPGTGQPQIFRFSVFQISPKAVIEDWMPKRRESAHCRRLTLRLLDGIAFKIERRRAY